MINEVTMTTTTYWASLPAILEKYCNVCSFVQLFWLVVNAYLVSSYCTVSFPDTPMPGITTNLCTKRLNNRCICKYVVQILIHPHRWTSQLWSGNLRSTKWWALSWNCSCYIVCMDSCTNATGDLGNSVIEIKSAKQLY